MGTMNEDLPPVMPPEGYGTLPWGTTTGMGPIRWPGDGHIGSGDAPAEPAGKKKKKTYSEKPAHKVLSFEEFMKTAKDEQN